MYIFVFNLGRINTENLIKINAISIENIANYETLYNALIREAIEITKLKNERLAKKEDKKGNWLKKGQKDKHNLI